RWLARLAAVLGLLCSVVLPSRGALAEPVIDQVGQLAPGSCCLYLPIGNTAAGEESYGELITPQRAGQLTALWFAAVCNACADIAGGAGGRYRAIGFAPAPHPYPRAPTQYVGTLAFESEIDSSLPASKVVNDTDPGLGYGGSGWFYDGGRPARIPDIGNDVH